MLRVEAVSKWYGSTHAVRGVSFSMERGEVVGLLGPNGAGKTTTIRMITGSHAPDGGRVMVAGHDTVSESLQARRRLGYLPESAPLYPEMKPSEYLEYRGRLFGLERRRRRACVEREMSRCKLLDVRQKRIGQLSKGYRQRVGLAAAILHEPDVVILDEPSNGLDPAQIVQVREIIREVSAKATMLLSSHVLPEVDRTCGRVLVIAGGILRADGSPSSLREAGAAASRDGNGSRFVVEARPPGADAGNPFARVAGVGECHGEGLAEGWRRFVITPGNGAGDLRESLAAAAASAGWTVRELHRELPTLEEVFRNLTETAA